jgi:flagellar hook-associated protein 2
MSSIKSTGLGSGLEINSIVSAIVGAEKDPAMAKITKSTATATAKISAYGMINSELSSFKSSYSELTKTSTFSAASATSSDSDILDAELGVGAETGNWEFEVKQLAQAHTLVSAANTFSSVNDPIGTGEISFRFGSYSTSTDEAGLTKNNFSVNADKPIETLTIDSSNNSLTALRDAINEGDYSVSASIINDGSDYRLVLSSKETGQQSAIELTVSDDDGNNTDSVGLSSFVYSADVKNSEQTSIAQDAKVVMNGITISRPNNEITNVIEGVTLNLNGETQPGKKVSLNISKDTSKVEEQLYGFVDNYNSMIGKMNELTAFNGQGAENGILNGDTTIRSIQNLLRGVLNARVDHIGGSIHSFADLGLLTARDGTLELDDTKFNNAMQNDMKSVANFFTAAGVASDSFISFDKSNSLTKPGSYSVEVNQLATQGTLTGTKVNNLTINEDNDTFRMRMDGVLSDEIVLSHGTYSSVDELATEFKSKINSDPTFINKGITIKVIEDAGKLAFTSNRYGSASSVGFTDVDNDFLSDLGIGVLSGERGLDVKGKISGVEAVGDGQFLMSRNGDSTGIKLLVEGGDLGERGTVAYGEGMSVVMNKLLVSIIDKSITANSGDVDLSEGIIDGKIDSLYKNIEALEKKQENLTYRTDKLEARLYKDFNAMDSAVSGLGNTMTYLKGALDALPGYTRE